MVVVVPVLVTSHYFSRRKTARPVHFKFSLPQTATTQSYHDAFLLACELVRCQLPINAASSDGRRNTCLKFTRGSLKSQGLSWALIQAQRDLVELRLRIARQVRSPREVLPNSRFVFSFEPRWQGLCGSRLGSRWM